MKLSSANGSIIFYWKLFPDFDAIEDKQDALVHKYGKGDEEIPVVETKDEERQYQIRQARKGQGKYRENLLKECWFCPFTHIAEPELLIASHIKPWKESDESEKTNPCNGLCLNALHDKAFDKGFMTINADNYTVIISNRITDIYNGETVSKFFDYYNGKQMILPEKFAPKKVFLEYHNDVIFQGYTL
jgi:putative restriction endonuclease